MSRQTSPLLITTPLRPSLDLSLTESFSPSSHHQIYRPGFQSRRPPISHSTSALSTSRTLATRALQKVQRAVSTWHTTRTTGQKIKSILTYIGITILSASVIALYAEFFPIAVIWAKKLKNLKAGWSIIWALIFISAFPPAIGYSTLITLAGLVYGVPLGWCIAASATVVGSALSFLVSRHVYGGWVRRRTAGDRGFKAFALVLENDGWVLLCMIRLCPLPYSFSNGAIATVPTVRFGSFVLAATAVTPKILSAVFIGSRLAAVGEGSGEDGGMSKFEAAVNWAGIVAAFVIAGGVAWYVYRRTMARARVLEALEGVTTPRGEGEGWEGYMDGGFEEDELDEYGVGSGGGGGEGYDGLGEGGDGGGRYRDD